MLGNSNMGMSRNGGYVHFIYIIYILYILYIYIIYIIYIYYIYIYIYYTRFDETWFHVSYVSFLVSKLGRLCNEKSWWVGCPKDASDMLSYWCGWIWRWGHSPQMTVSAGLMTIMKKTTLDFGVSQFQTTPHGWSSSHVMICSLEHRWVSQPLACQPSTPWWLERA